MKPAQARIADFWCKLMHTEPMWPSHGQYQCRKCGRRHRVGWEEVRDQSALVTATESRSIVSRNGFREPFSRC
jgi:hypothetical protein